MCCQGVSPQTLREQSTHSTLIWSRKGFQHFSGYFTVPKLYGGVPSDLSVIKLPVSRRAGIPASHMTWFMQMRLAHFQWLQAHSCEEYHRQLGKWCTGQSAPASCTYFLTRDKNCRFYGLLGVCFGKLLDLKKSPFILPLFVIYLYFMIYSWINARGVGFLCICNASQWQMPFYEAISGLRWPSCAGYQRMAHADMQRSSTNAMNPIS